jgi:hypothetical protein
MNYAIDALERRLAVEKLGLAKFNESIQALYDQFQKQSELRRNCITAIADLELTLKKISTPEEIVVTASSMEKAVTLKLVKPSFKR